MIGHDTSIQDRCTLLGDISLGRYCMLAPNVFISSGRHYFDLRPAWLIRDQDELASLDSDLKAKHSQPIYVHDDCWLGVNCVILPGITIGKGVIVGANSVVTADVKPYTVVAGAPARNLGVRLEFAPPCHIRAADPNHWPYFYSGFQMRGLGFQECSERDGLTATGPFQVCLERCEHRAVRIVAKSSESDGCSLMLGDTRKPLTTSMQELEFEVATSSHPLSRLSFSVQPVDARVVVGEAWLV